MDTDDQGLTSLSACTIHDGSLVVKKSAVWVCVGGGGGGREEWMEMIRTSCLACVQSMTAHWLYGKGTGPKLKDCISYLHINGRDGTVNAIS